MAADLSRRTFLKATATATATAATYASRVLPAWAADGRGVLRPGSAGAPAAAGG